MHFKSGIRLEADLVILPSAYVPNPAGRASRSETGGNEGIYVDEYLMTSQSDVYAVGDAIEYPHPITGKPG